MGARQRLRSAALALLVTVTAASEAATAPERYAREEATGGRPTPPVRAPLPAHLPCERAVAPSPSACPCCGGKLSKRGEDITETQEVTPRRWKVVQTVREVTAVWPPPCAWAC